MNKQMTADRVLDAVISLERGDDIPSKTILKELSENGPTTLMLCWRATGKIDDNISDLLIRINSPPNLTTMLKIHSLMLAEEGDIYK